MKQPKGNVNYEATFPVQLMTAGISACIADFLTFPLDTAKVRLQVGTFLSNTLTLLNKGFCVSHKLCKFINQNKVETSCTYIALVCESMNELNNYSSE